MLMSLFFRDSVNDATFFPNSEIMPLLEMIAEKLNELLMSISISSSNTSLFFGVFHD